MAGSKEIRNKIKSVQSTRKITKAMEMVAASKMKKAQDRMRASRPLRRARAADRDARQPGELPRYKHPFLAAREVKHVGVVVVTTDKGLCGGLNSNVLRLALSHTRSWPGKGVEVTTAIGGKGEGFMQRLGAKIVSQAVQLGDRPQVEWLVGAGQGAIASTSTARR